MFPALAIPVEAKQDFECPQGHVHTLKSFIPNVTKILIIGWRATEKPFLELLKQELGHANPHIMIANGSQTDSESAATNIRRSGMPAQYSMLDDGFTDFNLKNRGREFLSS